MFTTLIEATELAELLHNDDTVVLDCRFSLADIHAGSEQFRKSHIQGAHYAHLEYDLSSPVIESQSGRHPLPAANAFVQRLREWGVNDHTQVVAYDDMGGAMAARAWWLCRWVGHEACAVLNGGIGHWQQLNLPVSSNTNAAPAGTATLRPSLATLVNAEDVLDSNRLLVDARAPERYLGEVEPLDPIAGHIPGAVNKPFTRNIDESGKFSSNDKLLQRFETLTHGMAATDVTHYCGSGVTAAHNILAMLHAGLGMTALYAGSWSEWVQDDARPVAK